VDHWGHCRDEHDKHCALWSVDELTRLCMERATSARQCVQLMGAAAEERGFYGSDGFEGSGI
jgi:dipeptidase